MRAIALDTNAYTAFKTGRPDAIEIIRAADAIGISVVVLGELLGGFALGDREARNRAELRKFLSSPRVQTHAIGETTADYYARVYASLRRKGRPIPTNDLWIAASALQQGVGLFSYDAHFNEIDGLISGHTPDAFLL